MRIRSRSTPQDRRRLLRRTGTAICPRVHRDALGRRTRTAVLVRAGNRPTVECSRQANGRSGEDVVARRLDFAETRSRLPSARRRRRRDRRLSSPGSALRSAPPYSPATWRPAGEVRHRPCFEGPSRQRHRTDTAHQRPPTERTPRPDNRAGQKIWASLASTDVSVDPFDQTTKSGADHDTDADVAVINPRTDSTFSPLSASGAKRLPTTGIDDDEHHRLYATRWAAAGSRSTIWTVDATDAQPSFDRVRLVSRF